MFNSFKTTDDSYDGKYLIGESATIEFFKPKQIKHFGDELFDFGIGQSIRFTTNQDFGEIIFNQ